MTTTKIAELCRDLKKICTLPIERWLLGNLQKRSACTDETQNTAWLT